MTVPGYGYRAVIDIGKTNAKLALLDPERGVETDSATMPNRVINSGPYPHYDIDAIWRFLLDGLARFHQQYGIAAISITTHGATAALVGADGGLVLPVLDYEHDGPDTSRGEYARLRPDFAETGSPSLPIGLNLGAQLYWQARAFPEEYARATSILMYPQYWGFRLTGVRANEVTSLGCHTDLWCPHRRDFSSLVDRMGWRGRFAPLRRANEMLGSLTPELARETGLGADTPVYVGIHDSNASLLPHLLAREAPFSVVSTGTWVIAMAIGGESAGLDPARDTLINVNIHGDPVPSARFMGGREYGKLTREAGDGQPAPRDIESVLDTRKMILPSVQRGSGPFPDMHARIVGDLSAGERIAAASLYLACMTATCMRMNGAAGATVVEGPFARNDACLRMLAAITGRPVLRSAGGTTGTSIGAAMLCGGPMPLPEYSTVDPPPDAGRMKNYAAKWRTLVNRQ